MSTSLTFDQHMAVLVGSGRALSDSARVAGLDAAVPTCPDWTVAQLVAHQAMVHRWATEHISLGNPDEALTDEQILDTAPDLLAFYDEGLDALVVALEAAPPDLDVFTFLKDAPAPRQFWARRQAHETTMHAVDVQAALLGRVPSTIEAGIDRSLAVDGLDELLRGFFTRGKSKLFDGSPFVMVVAPSDADRRWLVRVDERLTVDPGDADDPDADARLTGTAAALYLALWNRGDDIEVQ
ncbi:MAG TPA: maleylpyruvate isomerase family mycothiol-dependent enzyme, partial [Acidimicrobiales bacterium]|nr:maleylpyruvate isomerase family mycothiol-dependent enzyme [Acidimicrobiales bacterium]